MWPGPRGSSEPTLLAFALQGPGQAPAVRGGLCCVEVGGSWMARLPSVRGQVGSPPWDDP